MYFEIQIQNNLAEHFKLQNICYHSLRLVGRRCYLMEILSTYNKSIQPLVMVNRNDFSQFIDTENLSAYTGSFLYAIDGFISQSASCFVNLNSMARK